MLAIWSNRVGKGKSTREATKVCLPHVTPGTQDLYLGIGRVSFVISDSLTNNNPSSKCTTFCDLLLLSTQPFYDAVNSSPRWNSGLDQIKACRKYEKLCSFTSPPHLWKCWKEKKTPIFDLFFSKATNQAKSEFSELNFSIYIYFFCSSWYIQTLPMFADLTEMLCWILIENLSSRHFS